MEVQYFSELCKYIKFDVEWIKHDFMFENLIKEQLRKDRRKKINKLNGDS